MAGAIVSNIVIGPAQAGGNRLITVADRFGRWLAKLNPLELHSSDFRPATVETFERQESGPSVAEEPEPTPPPNPDVFRWSGSTVDCHDVSGIWSDTEIGGTWTLSQTKNAVSGSLTTTKADCGSVTWHVSGQVKDKVATITATQPVPAVDKCGTAADTLITATVTPDCTTAAVKVEIKH
jgi:hypothetical protein